MQEHYEPDKYGDYIITSKINKRSKLKLEVINVCYILLRAIKLLFCFLQYKTQTFWKNVTDHTKPNFTENNELLIHFPNHFGASYNLVTSSRTFW